MGGVRAQFSMPISIRMSLYSIPFFNTFDEVMGHPSGYRAQGYLFVATEPRHMDYLRENYGKHVAAGLKDVHLLCPEDVKRTAPEIRADDVLGGRVGSTHRVVAPHRAVRGS